MARSAGEATILALRLIDTLRIAQDLNLDQSSVIHVLEAAIPQVWSHLSSEAKHPKQKQPAPPSDSRSDRDPDATASVLGHIQWPASIPAHSARLQKEMVRLFERTPTCDERMNLLVSLEDYTEVRYGADTLHLKITDVWRNLVNQLPEENRAVYEGEGWLRGGDPEKNKQRGVKRKAEVNGSAGGRDDGVKVLKRVPVGGQRVHSPGQGTPTVMHKIPAPVRRVSTPSERLPTPTQRAPPPAPRVQSPVKRGPPPDQTSNFRVHPSSSGHAAGAPRAHDDRRYSEFQQRGLHPPPAPSHFAPSPNQPHNGLIFDADRNGYWIPVPQNEPAPNGLPSLHDQQRAYANHSPQGNGFAWPPPQNHSADSRMHPGPSAPPKQRLSNGHPGDGTPKKRGRPRKSDVNEFHRQIHTNGIPEYELPDYLRHAMPSAEALLDLKKQKRKRIKDPNKPKQPKSSFILWSMANRPKLREANPELGFREFNELIGERWRNIALEERATWDAKQNAENERYKEEMKAYKAGTFVKPVEDKGDEVLGEDSTMVDEDSVGAGDRSTILGAVQGEGLATPITIAD